MDVSSVVGLRDRTLIAVLTVLPFFLKIQS
jgi:hypothetical protein